MKKQSNGPKNTRARTWIFLVLAVVVVAVIGVLVINKRNSSTATIQYQTVKAAKGTLTATIGATGTVRSNQTAVMMWQNTATIGSVNVKPGDQIKAGDVLGSLLLAPVTQSTLASNLVTAQENLAELTSPEAIANAKLSVTAAQTDVTNAQTAVNNEQYWQNNALIQNYYAAFVIAKANLDKAQTAYDNAHVGQYINNANEANAYQSLYKAQQAYNTAKYYYSLYSQAPTQTQLNQAQANLDLANATLKNSQIYLAALTGGDVPADATGTALLQLEQAKLAVQTAQENVDAAKLTAPFNGTITQSNAIPKAVVKTGTQAFRIDDLSNLVIVVQVVEVDINHVQVGQPATITFDAIPNKTYTGKVITTDLAGTTAQSSVNFNVTVQVTDADATVKPGMSANVTIVTNKVDSALLVPSTSIFSDANGQPYVYLVQNGATTKVPVTIGAVSDSTTQITNNTLKAGDTIVLSFASTTSSSGFGFRLGGGGGGGAGGGTVVKSQPITTP